MWSRFCFVFIVFYFTAVLILTVYLRNAESRIFYELCAVNRQQNHLKQQLWQKQLRVESLISPTAVSEHLEEEK
ncbi:hypothetical protein ACFL1G_00560 [Planctomycetota bacterium]